jgi:hypothetical protein
LRAVVAGHFKSQVSHGRIDLIHTCFDHPPHDGEIHAWGDRKNTQHRYLIHMVDGGTWYRYVVSRRPFRRTSTSTGTWYWYYQGYTRTTAALLIFYLGVQFILLKEPRSKTVDYKTNEYATKNLTSRVHTTKTIEPQRAQKEMTVSFPNVQTFFYYFQLPGTYCTCTRVECPYCNLLTVLL